ITSQIADAGGPEGELALLKFAERYANASVTIDGVKYPVQIPELAMAERRAENYGADVVEPVIEVPAPVEPTTTTSGSLVSDIQSIQQNPGSSEWDAEVGNLLVAYHDGDGSGVLDQYGEVEAIDCAAWKAIDKGVSQQWSGLWGTYGFAPEDSLFIGYAISIDVSVKEAGTAALRRCGLDTAASTDTFVDAEEADWPDPYSGGDVAAYVRSLPNAGTSKWDSYVGVGLVGAYDTNGSGTLDSSSEVGKVHCTVWQVIDDGVKSAFTGYDTVNVYGLDSAMGSTWSGGSLGLSLSVGTQAASAIRQCTGGEVAPRVGGGDIVAFINGLSDGGSAAWDAQVMAALVEKYDSDGSGMLDSSSEVNRTNCAEWQAIDAGVRSGWGNGLWDIYSFDPSDDMWVGSSLGIDESMSYAAADMIGDCGLGDGGSKVNKVPRSSDNVAATIGNFGDPLSSGWDAAVKELLVVNYDANGSGSLDRSGEVEAVTCDAWQAMHHAGTKSSYSSTGFKVLYGFDGSSYLGGSLGIDLSMVSAVSSALSRCVSAYSGDGGTHEITPVRIENQGNVAESILNLGDPLSSSWDSSVKDLLVANYDSNSSGSIDSRNEVENIPCDAWQAVDYAGQQSQYSSSGFKVLYGFDGSYFLGGNLGVEQDMALIVGEAFEACVGSGDYGGYDPGGGEGEDVEYDTDTLEVDDLVALTILALDDPLSSSWDAAVKTLLLTYDDNGSGSIDRRKEVEAIPCDAWQAMDFAGQQSQYSSSGFKVLYGFDGSYFLGGNLGFEEGVALIVGEAFEACIGGY
ncbi:MAG: hypothetical protein HN348_08310, partial [Proteobacteria bacterium]|nr:hypothetical protein [Pseudomonadota bacterium]